MGFKAQKSSVVICVDLLSFWVKQKHYSSDLSAAWNSAGNSRLFSSVCLIKILSLPYTPALNQICAGVNSGANDPELLNGCIIIFSIMGV